MVLIYALACLAIATAKELQRYEPREFIASQPQNTSLWSLQCSLGEDAFEEFFFGAGDSKKYAARTFLFVPEPHRTHLECGEYEPGEALAVNGILEDKDDKHDDTLSRWCLRSDTDPPTAHSQRLRRTVWFRQISPAPTLRELAAKSTGEKCRPRSVRYSGFFKSARELLCFA